VATTKRGASVAHEAEEIMNRPPVGLTSLSNSELESLAAILEHARAEANIDPRT